MEKFLTVSPSCFDSRRHHLGFNYALSIVRRVKLLSKMRNREAEIQDALKGLIERVAEKFRFEGLYEFEYGEPKIDAVLLSHSHMDHSAHVSFLKRSIPVHCGFSGAA